MLVKICGVQTIEAAQIAAQAGANWIGFVFAESKRRVSLEQARLIKKTLPSSIKTVGVFVNESVATMNDYASRVPLDYVQLHGQEEQHIAEKLHTKVIKAFSSNEIQRDKMNYPCEYILVDAPRGEKYVGGNGIPFDWTQLKQTIPKHKLIIAGGLTAANVHEAIRTLQPAAVDVSSGVETNGEKDRNKIITFINTVKGKDDMYGNVYDA